MRTLCLKMGTLLLAGLALSDESKWRKVHVHDFDFGDRFRRGDSNKTDGLVPGDFMPHSSDTINGGDVKDILQRIEAISSRIVTKTQKRRRQLLLDKETNREKETEAPEFQLIFLSTDEKNPDEKEACAVSLSGAECIIPSETEASELVTTVENNTEEMITESIEDNATGTDFSDSLEDVIKMLNAFQHDMTSTESTNEASTNINIMIEALTELPNSDEEETTTQITDVTHTTEVSDNNETTTALIQITDSTTMNDSEDDTTTEISEVDEQSTETFKEDNQSPLKQTLSSLKTANLTKTDEKILIALLELEELRGEQKEKKEEIKEKMGELEALLSIEEMVESQSGGNTDLLIRVNKLLSSDKVDGQQARRGKTISDGFLKDKTQKITTTINLFENLQAQLFSLLNARHKFLQDVSNKVNQELGVIKQTVNFLQQLVDFKLDQGELLLGKMNPILNILQSGSTSVFLMISRFFQAVESVLAMKEQFLRAFATDTTDIQETKLLERIKDLKLNTILPAKMRFLLNVHANSDLLGHMVQEIFQCVGELVEAKVDVIESVGKFVESKIEYLSGLTGPGLSIQTIIEAVRTGTLYKLANFGPAFQNGIPGFSDQELEEAVEGLISVADPMIPIIGPVKPLLVNHKVLGMLAGRSRDRVVNRYLARKLSQYLEHSKTKLIIRQGETVLKSWLPPLQLGTTCTNEIHIGRSFASVVVNRNSRFSATTGVSVHSHAPPTLDLFGFSRIYANVDISGSVNAKIGHEMFGKCLPKLSGASPLRIKGNAMGNAFAKVIVKNVRLETRKTLFSPILSNVFRDINLGVKRPHLVFNFHIKLDGTIANFDISQLQLSGCEFSVLGIKMFSHCAVVEEIIKKQIRKVTQNTFPLNDAKLLREIEKMIKMRIGDELTIPLVLTDLNNLDSVNRVIAKTGRLIDLNINLFNRLASFTRDMKAVKNSKDVMLVERN